MYILSITFEGHDSSIALLKDNKILFSVLEERVSRIKHDRYVKYKTVNHIKKYTDHIDSLIIVGLPYQTAKNLQYYLNFKNTKHSHVTDDHIVRILIEMEKNGIKFDEIVTKNQSLSNNVFENRSTKYNNKLNKYKHHTYHAASAFYMSGFDEAICLIMDGWGSRLSSTIKEKLNIDGNETTSIYHASYPNNFVPIFKNYSCKPSPAHKGNKSLNEFIKKDIPYSVDVSTYCDIGILYAKTSMALRWGTAESGKTMGLAAYGVPNDLPEFLIEDTLHGDYHYFHKLSESVEDLDRRINSDFQLRANLAYNVQKALEKIFLERAKYCYENFKTRNLVLSGGVTLNVLGASIIKKNYPEFNIFIDPIAHDGTIAIGSALLYYYDTTKSMDKTKLETIYLGPEYDLDQIRERVKTRVEIFNECTPCNNLTITYNMLSDKD